MYQVQYFNTRQGRWFPLMVFRDGSNEFLKTKRQANRHAKEWRRFCGNTSLRVKSVREK